MKKLFNVIVWIEQQNPMCVQLNEYEIKKGLTITEFLQQNELEIDHFDFEDFTNLCDALNGQQTHLLPIHFSDEYISCWGTTKQKIIEQLKNWFDEHQQFFKVIDTNNIIMQLDDL